MSADQNSMTLAETNGKYRDHAFFPTDEVWNSTPKLYATEHVPADEKVIHIHYFLKDCDWWVAEVDHATGEAFGYVRLHGDDETAEWGYIDLRELETLYQHGGFDWSEYRQSWRLLPHLIVERDLSWQPRQFFELGLP